MRRNALCGTAMSKVHSRITVGNPVDYPPGDMLFGDRQQFVRIALLKFEDATDRLFALLKKTYSDARRTSKYSIDVTVEAEAAFEELKKSVQVMCPEASIVDVDEIGMIQIDDTTPLRQ